MRLISKHARQNRQRREEPFAENERRTGMDRRMLTYDCYLPERRVNADRRSSSCRSRDKDHGEWRDRRRYA